MREKIGHLHGIAVTLDQWAVNHAMRGDLESARGPARTSGRTRREQGEPSGLAIALNNYAMTLVGLKESAPALAANDEAHATVLAAGLHYLLPSTLDTRGMLQLERGRLDEAIATFHHVLALPDGGVSDCVGSSTQENLADAYLRQAAPLMPWPR